MRLQKQQPLTVLAATLVLASLAGPRAFGQEAPKAPTGNTLELGFEERVRQAAARIAALGPSPIAAGREEVALRR